MPLTVPWRYMRTEYGDVADELRIPTVVSGSTTGFEA